MRIWKYENMKLWNYEIMKLLNYKNMKIWKYENIKYDIQHKSWNNASSDIHKNYRNYKK